MTVFAALYRPASPAGGIALALLALTILASGAGAGAPGHGAGAEPRALHTRLPLADIVAIGTVEAVGAGRIRVRDAEGLVGRVPREVEVKRSPSRAPGLEAGEDVLLVLRGARSPFLLVDTADEIVRLDGGAARARWRDAISRLAEIGGRRRDPEGRDLRDLYTGWLDGPWSDLRSQAVHGLRDTAAPFQPLPEGYLAERIRVAADTSWAPEVRDASALVATQNARGTALAVEALAAQCQATPRFVVLALAGGAKLRVAESARAFASCLRSPAPGLRGAALSVAAAFAQHPDAQSALDEVATADPEPHLRAAAERALEGRRTPRSAERRAGAETAAR